MGWQAAMPHVYTPAAPFGTSVQHRQLAVGCQPSPSQARWAPPPPPFQALAAYHADVVGGHFPSETYSPYKIAQHEASQLLRDLEREGLDSAAEAVVEQLEAKREAAAARAE